MSSIPPAPVQGYVDASNAFDGDPLTGWFPGDSLVNDTRREFCERKRSGPASTARSSATR